MRYLGVVGLAMAVMAAFPGGASASELTSPEGTKLGVGAEIKAESEGSVAWTGTIETSCKKSTMEGKVTNAGSLISTVKIELSNLAFSECGSHTVTVIKSGSLEIHSLGNGDGTLTSTGAEVTVLTHVPIAGTRHCIYVTNNTDLGTITSSSTTGGTATMDIGPLATPQTTTDAACGSDAEWEGSYKVTSPDYLDVDLVRGPTLTSPAGTTLKAGAEIKAESEGAVEFSGTVTFSCQKSTLEGKLTGAKGRVIAELNKLTFSECGNQTVEVLKPGSLEIHSKALGIGGSSRDGTLTSTGAEVTILTHGVFLGTRHCIYITNKTDIGTVTGSSTTGGTATLDIGPVSTPQTTTDGTCGSDAKWGGSYKVTSPDYLDVDPPPPSTTLTSPAGTVLEAGAEIKAESEAPFEITGEISVSCQKSALEVKVTDAGGEGATVKAEPTKWTFSECGGHTVEVIKPGTLEIHSIFFGILGSLTSTGAEVTVLTHGVLGTQHCVYVTNGTRIGTLVESDNTEGTARMTIAAEIPPLTTDAACGEEAEWVGSYEVASPDYLDVE